MCGAAFTHLEMGCGTTSGRHSPTIRQTQIDYKKNSTASPCPRVALPAVSGTIVQALSMLTFVARGTHTAIAKALHAPFPEHPPGQLRK